MNSVSLDAAMVVEKTGMWRVKVGRCGYWCGMELGVWDSLENDVLLEGGREFGHVYRIAQ